MMVFGAFWACTVVARRECYACAVGSRISIGILKQRPHIEVLHLPPRSHPATVLDKEVARLSFVASHCNSCLSI